MRKQTEQPVDLCVLNDTSGTVLASHAALAATFFQRFVGLMGKRRLRHGEGLVLAPCQAVHTMFMNFPIDLLFLDETGRVVAALGDVAPYCRSPVVREAFYVVELPAGVIAGSGTKVGDKLTLMPNDGRGRVLQ
ncbi:MAG: DUF192 domain-containing protein [Chloroflexota bacterium]